MAKHHRGFLEVRGISRESSGTLTAQDQWGRGSPPPGLCMLSTLSSNRSLLSNAEFESTEGLHSSGISSADSWAQDDEFDRNATRKVRSMFEELQSALFEGRSCRGLEREIGDWTETFPHMRCLGRQVCAAAETGTQFIVNDAELTAAELDLILDRALQPSQTLVIEGSKIKQTETLPPFPTEEILAAEGSSEEYIALDKPESISSVAQVYYKYHQRPGFPPITPKSHRRHTIHSLVFESVWADCINACEPLVSKICSSVLPSIRGSRSQRPSLSSPLARSEGEPPGGLQDVITIKRLPLQERSSSQQTILRDMSQISRPHSSRLTTVKSVSLLPFRQKSREHLLLPPMDRPKILTFQSPIFNSSVATSEGGIHVAGLRGRQLRQQPRRLPPLVSDAAEDPLRPVVGHHHEGESRAASAQPEESSRRNMRSFYTADGRPNTTSTFRVPTARGRSTRKNVAPIGLEIFGASTGTTVTSKGSRQSARLDLETRLTVALDTEFPSPPEPRPGPRSSPTKTQTITENVFTKPGRVWITGVQGAALRKSSNVR